MSQNYDPNNSEHASESEGGQAYPTGRWNPAGEPYPARQSDPAGQNYPAQQGSPAGPVYGAAAYGGAGYGGAGYGGGQGYAGGAGFGSEPPPPPRRRNHKRGLIATGAVALLAGAAAGGLIGSMNTSSTGTATATSKTVLTTSQIAARVDPGLVDVVATDGDEEATSAGTGIVLTSTGEILTNNHVIEGATAIKVTDIGNGKAYTAKVVGYDATQDVAVIQLENASGLTVASLGDSSTVATGATVVALGNAGGKGGTPSVASGTVTGLNQSITASDELSGTAEQLTGLIEDNADIQAGDSGGSLVNSYGQVIGMDTAASTGYSFQQQSGSSSTSTEDAYAIPINEALSIAKQIEAGTTSTYVHIGTTAFLGVEIESASQSSGSGYGSEGGYGGGQSSSTGVTVAGTLTGSPAAEAGLAEGDQITALAGQSVTTSGQIAQILVKYHPGESISVTWTNASGQSQTSNLTLASGPAA